MQQDPDPSSGYDAIADKFIAARSQIGLNTVREWARNLPANSDVIDIGAGHGEPLTSALIEAGHTVHAIEASPKLVAAYEERFPDIPIACERVEDSQFFNRTFGAALMIGLIFLLDEDRQIALLERLSSVLRPGGQLLFSAPSQVASWQDIMTGRQSHSLGEAVYEKSLGRCGFSLVAQYQDEGDNHYYCAKRLSHQHVPTDRRSQSL